MARPDRRLAPRARVKRAHRSGQQPDETYQTNRFGFTRFANYRIRVLLYAGKPDWDLLATITPH